MEADMRSLSEHFGWFWAAPILGAVIGAGIYRYIGGAKD